MLITDPDELAGWLSSYGAGDLLRLESLAAYAVPSDGGDFDAYAEGRPGPDMSLRAGWHATLAAARAAGAGRRRVRIFRSSGLSLYERYACEWGYALNGHVEDIRVVDLGVQPWLSGLAICGDFWLASGADGARAAVMHYSVAGEYLGFEDVAGEAARPYQEIGGIAWRAGEPFSSWYTARPQLRRGSSGRKAP